MSVGLSSWVGWFVPEKLDGRESLLLPPPSSVPIYLFLFLLSLLFRLHPILLPPFPPKKKRMKEESRMRGEELGNSVRKRRGGGGGRSDSSSQITPKMKTEYPAECGAVEYLARGGGGEAPLCLSIPRSKIQ